MLIPGLVRVVPTERWRLALEFTSGEVRLFDCSVARLHREQPALDWSALASPERFKHLRFDAGRVWWPGGHVLEADYLFTASTPLTGQELENQLLRVAFRNQAPTPEHPTHHVYYVCVVPFGARPFLIGESINGGHGEMGGSVSLGLTGLKEWQGWQEHFELSGCGWAVPMIGSDERSAVDAVVREVCRRADTDESDTVGYDWKKQQR
ncbi:hypothetical protein [Actinoplanes sp. NPDC026670]|uniref:hypothetical protein n=1 Tax=Actinoplanes sp. NPDC026670 TaxID=3154700 RepID=UPI0033DC625B